MAATSAIPSAEAPGVYGATLGIHQLTVALHLGVGAPERADKQTVTVDLRFYFPALPASGFDDKGEYLCYHRLSERVREVATRQPYRLIEYLAMEIYRELRVLTPEEVKIGIALGKPSLPLEYVAGGASFRYTDLPPFSWVAPE